jgi:hypothetical protein
MILIRSKNFEFPISNFQLGYCSNLVAAGFQPHWQIQKTKFEMDWRFCDLNSPVAGVPDLHAPPDEACSA